MKNMGFRKVHHLGIVTEVVRGGDRTAPTLIFLAHLWPFSTEAPGTELHWAHKACFLTIALTLTQQGQYCFLY
jgi:hypothetical protein